MMLVFIVLGIAPAIHFPVQTTLVVSISICTLLSTIHAHVVISIVIWISIFISPILFSIVILTKRILFIYFRLFMINISPLAKRFQTVPNVSMFHTWNQHWPIAAGWLTTPLLIFANEAKTLDSPFMECRGAAAVTSYWRSYIYIPHHLFYCPWGKSFSVGPVQVSRGVYEFCVGHTSFSWVFS